MSDSCFTPWPLPLRVHLHLLITCAIHTPHHVKANEARKQKKTAHSVHLAHASSFLAVFPASLHLLMPPLTSSKWAESSDQHVDFQNVTKITRCHFLMSTNLQNNKMIFSNLEWKSSPETPLALICYIKRREACRRKASSYVQVCEGGLVKALIMDCIML